MQRYYLLKGCKLLIRERKEVELLNQQLEEQKKLSKAKEVRMQSTQERLLRKIADLEKMHRELKDEVIVLEKERSAFIEKSNTRIDLKKSQSVDQLSLPKKPAARFPVDILSSITHGTKVALDEAKPPRISKSTTRLSRASLPGRVLKKASSLSVLNGKHLKTDPIEIPVQASNAEVSETFKINIKEIEAKLKLHHFVKEIIQPNGKCKRTYRDGTELIDLGKGSYTMRSPDNTLCTFYRNGDSKTVLIAHKAHPNGKEVYWYQNTKTKHTALPDQTEIMEFETGQVETRHPDGKIVIEFPDKIIKTIHVTQEEEIIFPSGKFVYTRPDGFKRTIHPDGTQDIQENGILCKLFQNGTRKTIYPDGNQETVFPDGSIRVKNKLVDQH